MPSIRRILKTILTLATLASVFVGTSLPAQAQGGRAKGKTFSLKKAGPKAGAGSRPLGSQRSHGSGSGNSGMTSSQSKSQFNRSGSAGGNQKTNRARK